MSARNGIYLVLAFNVVYISALAACLFFIGGLHTLDFAAMRSKIEASASIEDLRPRALHALSAIESGDQAIGKLHEIAFRLVRIGITWAIVNSTLVYLLVRRARHYDTKA